MEKKKLAEAQEGSRGIPGQCFSLHEAIVSQLANGRFELAIRQRWGNNQGYLEEHGRRERCYRASTLPDLLGVGIAETRSDKDMNDPQLLQAIRSAIFEAEDQMDE